MLQRLVDWAGREVAQPVDEFLAAAIVDGRIAVEPVDVKNPFCVGLLVKALRPAKIR